VKGRALVASLTLLLALAGRASAGEGRRPRRGHARVPVPAAPAIQPLVPVDPIARARAREELTLARTTATVARARAQALIAYRLARRRSAEFLGDPARRAETARALDAALLMLKRSAFESSALERELVLARAERSALETGSGSGSATGSGVAAGPPTATEPAEPTAEAPEQLVDWEFPMPMAVPTLAWPARGTLVSGPGRRRDPATGTEAVSEAVEILSRMNEPVRAVAGGKVHRIAALPQGGYAVVVIHGEERISILSGLRRVDVAAGAELAAGDPIGLVGRDLDGAPVLTFELWQAGVAVDPRPWLPAAK
jgi:murein DD-endopeptidase MepM/ murein hydrolase activator NlpD